MKIINFISNKIFRIKRECWIKKLRKRLKNRNFTLISNNCCAGIIYSDLGLQFTSPTINLYFLPEEYLLFVKNLKAYVEGVMVDVSDPNIASFPIGSLNPNDCSLPAIRIYFMHYKNYKEAYDSWYRRCQRISYDNIFYLWEVNKANTEFSLIKEFDNLPIRKKIFCYENLPEIRNYHRFYFSESFSPGQIIKILSNGKRNIDEFDYVSFLNDKYQTRNV